MRHIESPILTITANSHRAHTSKTAVGSSGRPFPSPV